MDNTKYLSPSVINDWNELPELLRKPKNSKKVDYTVSQTDEDFIGLMKPFLSKDELRPSMMGIYFDNDCVVATDAHKLVTVPNTSKYRGYIPEYINEVYPKYQSVIPEPKQLLYVRKFDVEKLRAYINSIFLGKYTSRSSNQVIFKFDSLLVGFNIKFLDTVLAFFQKIGEQFIYIGGKEEKWAFSFCADKSFDFKKHPFCLLMPVYIYEENRILGSRDIDFDREAKYYFDFTDGEIHNSDGSIAEVNFKTTKVDKKAMQKPQPKAVEVVEPKPEAPKKVRVAKPKAEKPKPVEVVEKPKMDEKFRILLNSELPAYMLSSINELGKKTNGFTEFDETTKAGSEKLVQLVKDFLANKDNEEKQSVTKEVTKEVTKPDTKEEAPAMPKKNKDKLIAISKKIKLSLKYLKGDSKIKQQKVVKTLELAIKYLK